MNLILGNRRNITGNYIISLHGGSLEYIFNVIKFRLWKEKERLSVANITDMLYQGLLNSQKNRNKLTYKMN